MPGAIAFAKSSENTFLSEYRYASDLRYNTGSCSNESVNEDEQS